MAAHTGRCNVVLARDDAQNHQGFVAAPNVYLRFMQCTTTKLAIYKYSSQLMWPNRAFSTFHVDR
jgi:hypothetical protein